MSKRKAGVNDIIYELDNDDIELSSDDEVKVAKINRLEPKDTENATEKALKSEEEAADGISLALSEEDIEKNASTTKIHNGGKMSPKSCEDNITNNGVGMTTGTPDLEGTVCEVDSEKKLDIDGSKTTIYNEDIIIDSPASNSDLGVVGCENRIPLVTVRFRDRKLASNYKNKLKKFMLRLIKLHEKETSPGLDSETDLELDIWPEDLNDEDSEEEIENHDQDNLFFIDTDPCSNRPDEIPTYKNVSTLISNNEEREASPPPMRRGPTCFNCDGPHQLRDCPVTRNNFRIAEKRKQVLGTRVGRYHVEDEQKYGHLIPGRISGQLRHALGLKRHQLPLYIYRMRLLGYPPGWLEEARISHSGITMFDSTGTAILDPEEEEGEVCEPGSKDKYDIKKILDFPGFNVPASSRYREEAHQYALPAMSEQDSKIAMLQMLAPNAMKAYKRKKLTLFPSASNNASTHEVAEMDLDSGDEPAEFPSVPPLPDDAPPPPPPPPPKSPSPEPIPPGTSPSPKETKATPPGIGPSTAKAESSPPGSSPSASGAKQSPLRANLSPLPPEQPPEPKQFEDKVDSDQGSADEIEVIEVIKVRDIPVPEPELITIDDDDDDNLNNSKDDNDHSYDDVHKKAESISGRQSPSLDDLEEKKRLLLTALEGDDGSLNISSTAEPDNEKIDNDNKLPKATEQNIDEAKDSPKESDDVKSNLPLDSEMNDKDLPNVTMSPTNEIAMNDTDATEEMVVSTPESKTGHVKTTLFGTPVMNIASPYVKLPSDDKFAKDICDVINFENLPNSTGKYKKISNILKRVKSEVDRIQES